MSPAAPDGRFEFLLFAMEGALRSDYPNINDYAEKRRALFAYVANIERKNRMANDLIELSRDADTLATEIRALYRAMESNDV